MQFIIIVWTSPYYSIMALINIWGRHSDLSTWKRFFSRRTIWMSSSDEGHNCFNFFFHNSNAYEATHFLDKINCPRAKISYLLVSYRSMSRTAKNITSLTITSTFILYFGMNFPPRASCWCCRWNTQLSPLQGEKWNVWRVTIGLLHTIVNFCKSCLFLITWHFSSNEDILRYKKNNNNS